MEGPDELLWMSTMNNRRQRNAAIDALLSSYDHSNVVCRDFLFFCLVAYG